MPVITVFNQKGGVGKTTTSLNLAAALQRSGRTPLVIDLDPQAHLSHIAKPGHDCGDRSMFGFFQKNHKLLELVSDAGDLGQLIPAHLDLAKADALFGKSYNVVSRLATALRAEGLHQAKRPVVIDCSPMLGVLSLNALFACDLVLIPISADFLALNGALQVEKTLKALEQVLKRRLPRRYLLTRFDRRRKMAREILKQTQARFGADLCETTIAENVSVAESPALNRDVFSHAPQSRGAQDYAALLDELLRGEPFVDKASAAPNPAEAKPAQVAGPRLVYSAG